MSILNALRGITGEFDIGRILGASGGASYVVSPIVFQAIDLHNGGHFDPAAFCGGYGAGLGLAATGIGAMIAIKDRNVATARQTVAQPPLDDTGGKG
jgi:hypothetical protein